MPINTYNTNTYFNELFCHSQYNEVLWWWIFVCTMDVLIIHMHNMYFFIKHEKIYTSTYRCLLPYILICNANFSTTKLAFTSLVPQKRCSILQKYLYTLKKCIIVLLLLVFVVLSYNFVWFLVCQSLTCHDKKDDVSFTLLQLW